VQEVKLDILASRVANQMARKSAENNFTGHWNLAGENHIIVMLLLEALTTYLKILPQSGLT